MVDGGSGVHLGIVPERVVEVSSWPGESVTTQSLRMEANTAMAFELSIAPATSTLVLIQVQGFICRYTLLSQDVEFFIRKLPVIFIAI